MLVRYIGGRGPMYLPAIDREVQDGETIEVDDEFGAGLVAQGSSVDAEGNPTPGAEWEAVKSPAWEKAESREQPAG